MQTMGVGRAESVDITGFLDSAHPEFDLYPGGVFTENTMRCWAYRIRKT